MLRLGEVTYRSLIGHRGNIVLAIELCEIDDDLSGR